MSNITNKAAIFGVLVLFTLCFCLMFIHICEAETIDLDNIYPEFGVITEIDEERDWIIITTLDGNDWIWEGIEDWALGDCVGMIMDTMNTENIWDDQIIKVKYLGWLDI